MIKLNYYPNYESSIVNKAKPQLSSPHTHKTGIIIVTVLVSIILSVLGSIYWFNSMQPTNNRDDFLCPSSGRCINK